MSDKSSIPSYAKILKPEVLLEGVTVDEIKSIPHVQQVLERLFEEGRSAGFSEGFKKGLEDGAIEARALCEKNERERIKQEVHAELSLIRDILDLLRKPVPEMIKTVQTELISVFHDAMRGFVSNPENYDDKLVLSLAELLKTLPSNNNEVSIYLNQEAHKIYGEAVGEMGVKVVEKDMVDIMRVECEPQFFRVNPIEAFENLIRT